MLGLKSCVTTPRLKYKLLKLHFPFKIPERSCDFPDTLARFARWPKFSVVEVEAPFKTKKKTYQWSIPTVYNSLKTWPIFSLQKQLQWTNLHTALCRTRCSFWQKSFSAKLVWTILCTRTWFFCNHICRNIICKTEKKNEVSPFTKMSNLAREGRTEFCMEFQPTGWLSGRYSTSYRTWKNFKKKKGVCEEMCRSEEQDRAEWSEQTGKPCHRKVAGVGGMGGWGGGSPAVY